MKVVVWIDPDGDKPFSFPTEVQDETRLPDALANAFAAFHAERPGQNLFSVPIRIEQHA